LQKYGVAVMAASPRGGEPRILNIKKRSRQMSDKKIVKENSKAATGHGPGKEVKPGANIVPRSWWIKTAKESPNKG